MRWHSRSLLDKVTHGKRDQKSKQTRKSHIIQCMMRPHSMWKRMHAYQNRFYLVFHIKIQSTQDMWLGGLYRSENRRIKELLWAVWISQRCSRPPHIYTIYMAKQTAQQLCILFNAFINNGVKLPGNYALSREQWILFDYACNENKLFMTLLQLHYMWSSWDYHGSCARACARSLVLAVCCLSTICLRQYAYVKCAWGLWLYVGDT